MKVLVILVALSFGYFYGSSIAGNSGEDTSLDGEEEEEEEETCDAESWRPNTSIAISVSKLKNGEWSSTFVAYNRLKNTSGSINLNMENKVVQCGQTKYLALSGYFKETDEDDFAAVDVGESVNNGDRKEDRDKRINELTTIAEDKANQTMKALQIMEQRMNSFEKTQNNFTETLISFEKTQNSINETLISFEKTQNNINETLVRLEKTQSSFQKTLTNIEHFMNEVRGILNSTKNLDTEDKENATNYKTTNLQTYQTTSKPSPQVHHHTTSKPSLITRAKAHTFDSVIKGRNVQLSSDLRTATRTIPTEDSGLYAGVVSNSLLEEDELFQIRVDERKFTFSGRGIGFGVIKEKKEEIRDAAWIRYGDIKGTWAIYSSYFGSQSGKCNLYKDGRLMTRNGYPLPTHGFPVGTLLGVSRRGNGDLHFHLNGVDKGPAFRNVPKDVYAFVDVVNHVTEISIMN